MTFGTLATCGIPRGASCDVIRPRRPPCPGSEPAQQALPVADFWIGHPLAQGFEPLDVSKCLDRSRGRSLRFSEFFGSLADQEGIALPRVRLPFVLPLGSPDKSSIPARGFAVTGASR